jgi:peptide/nickel transport system substrate-binding protein
MTAARDMPIRKALCLVILQSAPATAQSPAIGSGAYRVVVQWAAREVPRFPRLHLQNVWALRRGLVHDPRMDGRTSAMGGRPTTN